MHIRDLPGAFVFAGLHRKYNIPATFFVFWDYSPIERAQLRGFLKLKDRLPPPLDIGLHDSPIDSWLIQQKFEGDRKAYAAWLNDGEASGWFSWLSAASDELERLNTAALERLKLRVEQTRTLFGPVNTIAAHGGEIGQTFRTRLEKLGPGAAVVRGFLARHWLTPERVRAAGLDAAVDCYGSSVTGWKELGCGGGTIKRFARSLDHHLVRNSAIQLLLHPYTWTGAMRDADLQQALFKKVQRRNSA